MDVYYAFTDEVESVGLKKLVRFDAINERDVDSLQSSGIFNKEYHNISPRIFELTVENSGIEIFSGLEGRRIETDRCYKIAVGDSGHPADVYDRLDLQRGNPVYISDVGFLDGRKETSRSLSNLFSLNDIPDASEEGIRMYLDRPIVGDTFLAVYNVGQGSCCAVCSLPARPHLYYDLGGGVTRNASTYPSDLQFCFTDNPPVILSHWDMDHWISGQKDTQALNLKWLVPRQRMGVSHLKFANELNRRGNLLVWPDDIAFMDFTFGRVLKLPAHHNRNYSGLVLLARVGNVNKYNNILCPGDAPYNKISHSSLTNISGLIATHHGGNYRSDHPPGPTAEYNIVYSFGVNNTYGHPKDIALEKHYSNGWLFRRDTSDGHSALPPISQIPSVPACGGNICSLTINQ